MTEPTEEEKRLIQEVFVELDTTQKGKLFIRWMREQCHAEGRLPTNPFTSGQPVQFDPLRAAHIEGKREILRAILAQIETATQNTGLKPPC